MEEVIFKGSSTPFTLPLLLCHFYDLRLMFEFKPEPMLLTVKSNLPVLPR
jgi:hypothetical protein